MASTNADQRAAEAEKRADPMGLYHTATPSEQAHAEANAERLHSKSPAHQAEEDEGMERG